MANPGSRVVETHVSWVFFVGDRVYKVKKPVQFDFLDWRSSSTRQAACREEVDLNRRLAPDVYEGVGHFEFPDGRREPAVVMKRLPADRSLAELIRQGAPALTDRTKEVAAVLARFHTAARRGPDVDACGTPAHIRGLWDRNLAALRKMAGSTVGTARIDELAELAERYIRGRTALFEERMAGGRTVDGHGDLLCADIFCMADGPRILDCLEFDAGLRYGDTVADVASLAMDLEHRGRPDLARTLVAEYQRESGDAWPGSLTDFWVAYRATVRAKVAFLSSCPITAGSVAGDRSEVQELLALARSHLRRAQVAVVLIGGLPGSGKSTLAAELGSVTGWPVYSSDLMRSRTIRSTGDQRYSYANLEANYRALVAEARERVVRGQSVVLDASWSRLAWRRIAEEMAEESAADVHRIRCQADPALARRRILARGCCGPSEATPEVARVMSAAWDPWPGAREVDTCGTDDATLRSALAAIPYRPG